jgi:hypothetical protein
MRYLEIVAVLCLATVSATPVAQADDRSRYAEPFTPAWAAPQLEMYPEVGPPGTQVQISGAKFHRDVEVFLGDQPMPIIERGGKYIVAVIPRYARGDDYIYVVDNTGRARTAVPFDVIRSPRYRGPRYDPRYRDPRYRRW